jgi:hypothetical protein
MAIGFAMHLIISCRIARSLIESRLIPKCRPVFGDPLTAGLKPISNGETSAQRGMRNEVPAIRGGLNLSMQHHLM